MHGATAPLSRADLIDHSVGLEYGCTGEDSPSPQSLSSSAEDTHQLNRKFGLNLSHDLFPGNEPTFIDRLPDHQANEQGISGLG